MLNIHVVPPALVGNNRAAARRLVEDALFSITCNEPDPSLARLMAADQLLVWREGMPTIPGNYTVYFPEAPIGLIPFVGAWGELGFGSGRPVAVWVEYLGGTHAPTKKDRMENTSLLDDGFEVLAMTPRYRVLGTRHGVVVIDVAKDQYAWIYVFRGGHKLRWKSIVYAAINGSEVTVIARIRDLDGEQTGSIIVNLYDEGYTESWAPPSPDTTAQQRPPD